MTSKGQWILIALFAAGSFAVFVVTVSIDPFAIFDDLYTLLACWMPLFAMLITLVVGQLRRRVAGWISTVLACCAAVGIWFGHVALIAMMSAGV